MSPLYKIGQGISKKNPSELSVAIYIASNNPTDKLSALQEIYNLGYDPSDYEIIFEGL